MDVNNLFSAYYLDEKSKANAERISMSIPWFVHQPAANYIELLSV